MTHADLLKLLLPPASIDPGGAAIGAEIGAEGDALDAALGRAVAILVEADPRSALELLPDWERVAGLPDPCGAGINTTLQERRAVLVEKLTAQGGSSIAYFTALAAAMGYAVEIEEYRPFIAGLSRCGDRLNGGHSVRYYWRVKVPGARVTLFRTGASQAGDRLGKIARAEDLECRLNRLKPAHTTVIVSYQGA